MAGKTYGFDRKGTIKRGEKEKQALIDSIHKARKESQKKKN